MHSIIKSYSALLGWIIAFNPPALAQDFFTISSEPSPAQFIQENPVLFNGRSGEFIVAWRDFRDGHEAYYAQLFDTQANPIGQNFKILSNEQVVFGVDGALVSFGHETFWNPPIEQYQGFMQIYPTTGIILDPVKVTEFFLPPDFVGCPAFGSFLGATETGYLLGDAFNSEIRTLGFDRSGKQNYTLPDSLLLGYDIVGFTMTSCLNGDYATFWLGIGEDYSFEDIELFGRFLDRNHKVNADSVSLFILHGTPCEVGYTMRSMTLADSLYQVFFANADTLWYLTCSSDGQLLQGADFKIVPRPQNAPDNTTIRTQGFGLSNVVDSTFSVFAITEFSWFENGARQRPLQTAKFEFATDGRFVREVVVAPTLFRNVRNIRKLNAIQSQIPFTQDNDVFLNDLEHLTIVDRVKLNDDTAGANQRKPSVIAAPNATFLVSWHDEKGVKRRMIDSNGALLGEEVNIAFEGGLFFPSGEFLAFWKANSSNVFTLGYRIYSPEWQVVEEEVLARRRNKPWWLNAKAVVIDDNSFVVLLQDSTDLYLTEIQRRDGVRRDSLIAQGENPFPNKLSLDETGTLWAVWRSDRKWWISSVRAFSKTFKPLSQTIVFDDIFSDQIQFFDGHLAYLKRQGYPAEEWGYFLVVRDTVPDEPRVNTKVAPFAAFPVSLQDVENHTLLVSWVHEKTFWTRSFNTAGSALIKAIEIHTSEKTRFLETATAASGKKLLYIWSDAVIRGNGFDILGRTLPVSLLTDVPSMARMPVNFHLHQNYPNPFNPKTIIRYDLPAPAQVRLTIFDVLGRTVRTLVSQKQPAGAHSVVWDGRDDRGWQLASGLYLYRLEAGDFRKTAKMLLLK